MNSLTVFWVFLRIGALSFGGPAATTGLVHSKVVLGLKWLEEKEFLSLVGMVNVLPGPNAVEMAMYIGQRRAGRLGFILGGVAFLLPGALLAGLLAALYVRYGTDPAAVGILYGIKPVIIAITAWSVIRLTKGARPEPHRLVLIAAAVALYLVGVDELLLLAAAAVIMYLDHVRRTRGALTSFSPLLLPPAAGQADLPSLIGVFLKAGALLFGGGAMLLAVLRGELVVDRGWITEAQLLDAITVGQVTPGPVLNTATFLGYTLGGPLGAVAVTVAVVIPSFLLMTAAGPALRTIDRYPGARAALDGVTLGAIAVLAGVTLELGRSAIVDPLTAALAALAALVLLRRPQSALPLAAAGAAVGILRLLVHNTL